MLRINLKADCLGNPIRLKARGHLGSRPSSECAAASALLQLTALQLIEFQAVHSLKRQPGEMLIYFGKRKKARQAEKIISAFYQAVFQLKRQFPEQVKLSGRWQKWKSRKKNVIVLPTKSSA